MPASKFAQRMEERDLGLPLALREHIIVAFRSTLTVVIVILLISYFASMGLGLFVFYGSSQGLDAASRQLTELPLSLLMIVNFAIPLSAYVGVLFLLLWLLYAAAFVLAWLDRPRFPSSIKNPALGLDAVRSNYLVTMPQISTVVFVAVILLQTLQESAGVQTGSISFENPVLGFLSISYAPFVEELSYRITTIGLLDGLHLLWKKHRLPQSQRTKSSARLMMTAMWKPERAKELLGLDTIYGSGVRRGISWFEWLLMILTSGAFGLAHYLSGGGWEIGKISTAMLSGLVMSYVYLRYGAYAPILLHWFFNYYFGVFDLASQLKMPGSDLLAAGVEILNFGIGSMLAVALILTWFAMIWSSRRRKD